MGKMERRFQREHMDKTITCDECGKEFKPGNRSDGLPNGVGFQLENGQLINICCDCIIKQGMVQ